MNPWWSQQLSKYGPWACLAAFLTWFLVVEVKAGLTDLQATQQATNKKLDEHITATKVLIEQIAAWQGQIISGQQVSRQLQEQQLSVSRQMCVSLAKTQQERRECAR